MISIYEIYRTAAADPIGHLGLFIGGILIGVGISSLYWSARWRAHDRRLDAWEREDRKLKDAFIRWLNQPCGKEADHGGSDQGSP